MILLIDNYDSFTYNLYQAFETLGYKTNVVRNDKLTLKEISQMKPAGIVISPGPGRPESAGISLSVIETFAGNIPLLGVCLGHQAIGQAFGAKVVKAKRLMHGKISKIFHDGKGVYSKLEKPFVATRYHSLVIDRKTLPKSLKVTSQTEDGTVMGVRHTKFNLEGVQFHPESVMTKEGQKLLENFLRGTK